MNNYTKLYWQIHFYFVKSCHRVQHDYNKIQSDWVSECNNFIVNQLWACLVEPRWMLNEIKMNFVQYNLSMFFYQCFFWRFHLVLLDLGKSKLNSKGSHSDILSLFLYTISPKWFERVMQYLLNCVYVGKLVCGGKGELVGWEIERLL